MHFVAFGCRREPLGMKRCYDCPERALLTARSSFRSARDKRTRRRPSFFGPGIAFCDLGRFFTSGMICDSYGADMARLCVSIGVLLITIEAERVPPQFGQTSQSNATRCGRSC